jgi:hypothetical protein
MTATLEGMVKKKPVEQSAEQPAAAEASRRVGRTRDPLDRAVEYAELIAISQESVSIGWPRSRAAVAASAGWLARCHS